MLPRNLIPKTIWQKDNHHFAITWNDSVLHTFRLSDLQRHCPCAACTMTPPLVNDEVRAHRLNNIGSYALRITFTSGCSHGLYGYDMLYLLGQTQFFSNPR